MPGARRAEAGGVGPARARGAAGRARAARGVHDPAQPGHEVPRRLLRVSGRQGRPGRRRRPRALARCSGARPRRGGGDVPAHGGCAAAGLLDDRGARAARGERRPPRVRRGGAAPSMPPRAAVRDGHRALPPGAHGREAPFTALLAREGWYCDLRPLALPLALRHTALEPDPLHRALLPVPASRRPGAAALHRGDVRGVLDPSRRGLPPLPGRRDGHGRAGRVRARLPRAVRLARRAVGRPHDGREKFHGIVDRIEVVLGRASTGRPIAGRPGDPPRPRGRALPAHAPHPVPDRAS